MNGVSRLLLGRHFLLILGRFQKQVFVRSKIEVAEDGRVLMVHQKATTSWAGQSVLEIVEARISNCA